MVKEPRQKKPRAQYETSVVLREDADNPPVISNFYPKFQIIPADEKSWPLKILSSEMMANFTWPTLTT